MVLTLREVLGLAKQEFDDTVIDLMKGMSLSIEPESKKVVEVKAVHINKVAGEEEYADSHYMWLHWARATTETLVQIGDVKELVVAPIDQIKNESDVDGLLQKGEVADQYKAWVEDMHDDPCYKGATWCMPECSGEGR